MILLFYDKALNKHAIQVELSACSSSVNINSFLKELLMKVVYNIKEALR